MGPLFAAMFMLILVGGLSIVLFGVALLANNRVLQRRSKIQIAVFSVLTSASFWIGGGLSGLLIGLLLSNHGTLESSTAVYTFFVVSFVSGLLIAGLVGRSFWQPVTKKPGQGPG